MPDRYSPSYVINSDGSDDEGVGGSAGSWGAFAADGKKSPGTPYVEGSDEGGYYQGDDDEAENEGIREGASAATDTVPGSTGLGNGRGSSREARYRDPLSDDDGEEGDPPVSEQPARKRPRLEEEDPRPPNGSVRPLSSTPHQISHQQAPSHSQAAPSHSVPSHPHPAYPPQPHAAPSNGKPHLPGSGLIMTSFFGIQPLDAVQKYVGHWMLMHAQAAPLHELEIEVKLGVLVHRDSGRRISLPVITETVLADSYNCEFRSEMSTFQHLTMNRNLNKEVENCSGRVQHPDLQPHEYYPIKYEHTFETDTVFSPYRGTGSSGTKRRVTTNTKTGEFKRVMEKKKLANLNVHCPSDEFDYRVSLNVELPCPLERQPTAGDRTETVRRKDRVTYKHSFFQVDLTQVKASEPGHPDKVTHELEVEVANAQEFLSHGYADARGEPSSWEALLGCLLNTVRILDRNAGPKIDPRKGPGGG